MLVAIVCIGPCGNIVSAQERNQFQFRFGIDRGEVTLEDTVIHADLMRRPDAKLMIVFQIVRGMIQNELNVVNRLCTLTDQQKQSLVDMAEREWSSRANTSVTKSVQPNVLGSVDLDGLSERITLAWLKQAAKPELAQPYEKELEDRMEYRKTAVISNTLDVLQPKLEMSGVQLTKVEQVLRSEWRDRWYRSFESTFFNSNLIPEFRAKWFENILTSAQQSAFLTREGQTVFGGMTSADECPFLPVTTRFAIGKLTSAESIKLEFVSDEDLKDRNQDEQKLQKLPQLKMRNQE
jgi:hypothetical protein